MAEESTLMSPGPEALAGERTQIAMAPGVEVTQAAVVIECPVCHTANPPGDRWCQDCGFLLTSPAPEALDMPSASGPRLVLDGREFELHAGANSLGRVGADVLLADPTVSRHHATLTVAEDGAWIEDAGSTNGTSVNGAPLPAGSRRPLRDGDTVKLGSVTVTLRWAEMPSGAGGITTEIDTVEPGAPAAPRVATLTGAEGAEHALAAGVTSLGRRAENTLALSGDPYVSGRHAEIRCDAGGCVLVDVGSTNGTFLRREGTAEAERLRPHDPQSLAPGDEMRLGQSTFVIQYAPPVPDETLAGDEAQSFASPSGEPDAAETGETLADLHAEDVTS